MASDLGKVVEMKLRSALGGLLVNVVFFGTIELGLRLYGFEYSRFPRLMQQQSADDHIAWQNRNRILQHFVPDAKRMWRAEPGFGLVNTLGYQGPVVPLQRDYSRRRILFLGDSCTNAGADQYPEKVVQILARMGVPAEPLIAGVGGYSTYQGLQFLEEALAYRPDLVVAYFGWNDHWFAAAGVPDNDFRPLTRFEMLTYQSLSGLRIYQFLNYLIHPPKTAKRSLDFQALVALTRVPPTRFADNLDEMIVLAERSRVPILFIAAPYGKGLTNRANDVLFPAQLIPSVHALYIDLERRVVARHPATAQLVDFLPMEFDAELMSRDGIHPTAAGYARIAEAVAGAAAKMVNEAHRD